MPAARPLPEQHSQRTKLATSYGELLDEFSSKDLRHVGNYTLGKLIGKGSFGKVYLATHKLTNGSKVVLKSAKKDDANLAREIHHHRQFSHSHIARLYEVIVTENLVWLVLEYCPGDELYNYLLAHGAIEPSTVQKIFTQLVGAVSYVHNKSCVHRDLKLENILLDKNENVKLVDFGFTREYEGKSSYLQTWCGTICYSAPEMIKGEKYAGEKVDVWSLGIILYALLCGELPFDDDEEETTKMRILKEDPKYPDHMPQGAKDLIMLLLSKRPLLRPALSDILMNPWLAEYAPHQQAILKLQQPAPFTTDLEKETLQRMRSAGVDIDQVIENVLAQRCDALAGWWALLIEKEERKARRRERKRREKEAEAKSLRRLSAASSRIDRMAPTIKELDEEVPRTPRTPLIGEPPKGRGRNMKRNGSLHSGQVLAGNADLPRLAEAASGPEESNTVAGDESPKIPPPIEKDSIRSASSSRTRPPLPPKEHRVSRGSMLQVVSNNSDLLSPNGFTPTNRRRKYQQPFFQQLASFKHWIKESAKRARSPATRRGNSNAQKSMPMRTSSNDGLRRISTAGNPPSRQSGTYVRQGGIQSRSTFPQRPRISTTPSTGSITRPRPSLSPSPLTPHSSQYRRGSVGLRGRKSTSSSVSSIRSVHHVHSHSKASSTSSATASVASPSASASGKLARSPHNSVKVLPGTPTANSFPSNIRVVRQASIGESTAAFSSLPPPSPGLIFAKRKRSPFKGPMLGMHQAAGANSPSRSRRRESGAGSRSGSVQGRRSGEIIEEEDEEEDEEGDGYADLGEESQVEEVEAFSPIVAGEEVVVTDEDGLDIPVPVNAIEDSDADVLGHANGKSNGKAAVRA
ncbi:kinase-like protein [Aulographum hederae CBS 113979]|uniref:Kinase-like protein n=1 Tax=Aulographum hederae CBS 113979 TaxID=1176131 RepID=A0A6G1H3A8_9PEZI|nr:kinase-like protein [Aulographum hederae CBS 113979]